jgi:hypothetical protein
VLRTALANFRKDIDRIDKVADWLTSQPALASDMWPATWAIRCGSVVLLSGYLESFLKDCMCSFITHLNGLGIPLTKLPKKMKYIHFENGARALSKQIKRDKKSGDMTHCEDLAARLASVSSATGYQLAWEAFADTRANPGPEVIKDIINSVGIDSPWEKLKAASPPNLGDLELFLMSFIEMRNECAHSGYTTSPPTASDLIGYGESMDGIGKAIVNVLEVRLTELTAL